MSAPKSKGLMELFSTKSRIYWWTDKIN